MAPQKQPLPGARPPEKGGTLWKGEHCGHHQNTATPPRPPGRESRRLQRWLARSTRPGLIRSSGLYTVLGRAFLTPLLAWPRSYYPTSSVSLRFVPLKCCAGAFVVRPCLPPVGAGTLLSQSTIATYSVLGAPASLIGSEFPQSTWLRPFICANRSWDHLR